MKTNKKYFNFEDLINKIENIDENDPSPYFDFVNDNLIQYQNT